jgi:hypothetical protein
MGLGCFGTVEFTGARRRDVARWQVLREELSHNGCGAKRNDLEESQRTSCENIPHYHILPSAGLVIEANNSATLRVKVTRP